MFKKVKAKLSSSKKDDTAVSDGSSPVSTPADSQYNSPNTTGTGSSGKATVATGGTTNSSTTPTATEKAASYVPGTIENREKKARQSDGVGEGAGVQGRQTNGQDGSLAGRPGSGTHTSTRNAGGYTGTGTGASGLGSSGTTGYTSGTTGTSGTIGGGQNLAKGDTSVYQPAQLEGLEGRRQEMAQVTSSTAGVPHVAQTGSFRETITAAGDKKPWEVAMMKTEQASREVASANLAQENAARALRKAEEAQMIVDKQAAEHNRLLAEAERQRDVINGLTGLQAEFQAAQARLAAQQERAARHNKMLSDAEALAAARQAELDKALAAVRSHEASLHAAADEYDAAMSKARGVHDDAGRLKTLALESDAVRNNLSDALEDLLEQLRLAEERMVGAERSFLQAQERNRALQQELAQARSEMEPILARLKKAEAAAYVSVEAAKGWEEKLAHLREVIERERAELLRLQRLQAELQAALEAALAEQSHQRQQAEPLTRALDDAERRVLADRERLREAEVVAKEAEARYHQLVRQADAHKMQAAEAGKAATLAAGEHEAAMKEARLHSDRHAELWAAAERAGDQGSAHATDLLHKLEDRVKNFAHAEP